MEAEEDEEEAGVKRRSWKPRLRVLRHPSPHRLLGGSKWELPYRTNAKLQAPSLKMDGSYGYFLFLLYFSRASTPVSIEISDSDDDEPTPSAHRNGNSSNNNNVTNGKALMNQVIAHYSFVISVWLCLVMCNVCL